MYSQAMGIMNSFINDIFDKVRAFAQREWLGNFGHPPHFSPSIDGNRGCSLGPLQQEAHCHLARDPDSNPPDLARRAGQARCFRRHQGRHQVHCSLSKVRSSLHLRKSNIEPARNKFLSRNVLSRDVHFCYCFAGPTLSAVPF